MYSLVMLSSSHWPALLPVSTVLSTIIEIGARISGRMKLLCTNARIAYVLDDYRLEQSWSPKEIYEVMSDDEVGG